jgi:preprotein translocase subunit YajC
VSGFGFFIIILAFFFLWLVVVRPQKRRQMSQQQMHDDLRIGDEVITAGGLHAVITELGDEVLRVRIAPQVEVELDRRAVAANLTAHDAASDEEPAADETPDPTAET